MAGIGVDFGTTNSAVALFDGEQMQLVQLEPAGSIMPTASYINRAFQTKVGQRAIDQYVKDNTGRRVELVPEVIGKSSIAVGGGAEGSRAGAETLDQDVYGAMIDVGLQGRLFRGVKRLLGDADVRRLMVFDQMYRLVALITPVLLQMRTECERAAGPVKSCHVGHPVRFEGRDNLRNATALGRLGEACGYAGFKHHNFYPEPIAATLSFLHSGGDGERVLAVDFGGGTLDLCVLSRRAGAKPTDFAVEAVHGIPLGGDHLDQRLFAETLFPLLGRGQRWRRAGVDVAEIETAFPFQDYEPLLINWAVTYLLNQNKFTTPVMDCIAQGGPAAEVFQRLRDFIRHNMGYVVFQMIKDAKARLSDTEETQLRIDELDINVTLSRRGFEAIISEQLKDVGQAVDTVLERAGLRPDDIDCVIRTGGSSLIPAVRDLLEDRCPARVVEHDPFASVATGLAIANFHGYQYSV